MKSVLFAAAAALAGLVLAPAAQAQGTCDDVARLGEQAELGFEDILGEETDTDLYAVTYSLPGAHDCYVSYDWSDSYVCIWRFSDEASAARFGQEQVSMLRACLTDDWKEGDIALDATDEWRAILGSVFTLSFDDADFAVTSRTDASIGRSPVVYEVEFSIDYTWL